ncbi:hypothetical protein P8452_47858 [Trifolium repens]|nr:hypothetical protein P8452_47858 [Trifolium repens]
MNRKLGNRYVIPPGFVVVFDSITGLILVPFYELIIIPFIRKVIGHCRGITSLQRIGVGLFVSIFAMPQFFLIGGAEVFTYIGQLEFFYDEATDGTKNISSDVFLSEEHRQLGQQ